MEGCKKNRSLYCSKVKKILLTILSLVLIKCSVWSLIIPIWQTPDEQAHFAQVQWYAENKNTKIKAINLSEEIYRSEQILGTVRDISGNNKYTYHPEYKNNIVGGFNDRSLPEFNLNLFSRVNYVATEAAMYPPLYYQMVVPFYDLVYRNGLIDRVYGSRLVSLVLFFLMVLFTYLIGRVIWQEKIKAYALTIFVAFHPMVSFLAAGVHPDNLLNLIYTLILLLCLLVIKNGIKIRYLVGLSLCIVTGYYTKPLIFLVIPVILSVVTWKFFRGSFLGIVISLLVLFAPIFIFIFQIKMNFVPYVTSLSPLAGMNYLDYLKFRIPKMVFEVWPWYWGVFKWLSLTLPSVILKIITRLAIIAIIGLFIKIIIKIKNGKYDFEFKAIIFFIVSSLSYIVYLLFWDWRLMQAMGFSQGIQGRYFFPNIASHMAILIYGLSFGKFTKGTLLVVSVAMIVLNLFVLKLLFNSYY